MPSHANETVPETAPETERTHNQHPPSSNDTSAKHKNTADNSADSAMPPSSLRPTPARLAMLASNLASVRSRINAAAAASASSEGNARKHARPRLVAVSKLKPLSDIFGLYIAGSGAGSGSVEVEERRTGETGEEGQEDGAERHLHFGENYVQELLEKSRLLWDYEEEGRKVGRELRWHFIGGLQSNKAVQLGREVKGLWCVESVDSVKKARGLGKGWAERGWRRGEGEVAESERERERLKVMIQVNTSGEEGKSGVEPDSKELRELARCVLEDEAERLELVGLMTIGAIARSQAAKEGEENEDFVRLKEVRTWLVKELGWEDEERLELSMGMSEDFESAVRLGSGEVRVGSTIFGERPPKNEAKVV